MFNKLRDFIIFIDLFGHTPSFVIKDKLKYKSFFGGIMSSLIFIIGITLLAVFSIELFEKKAPSINLSTRLYHNPHKLNYFNNFEFIIGILNENYEPEINEAIFYAKGYISTTKKNELGNQKEDIEIDLVPCDQTLSESKNFDLFKDIKLSGFYCISKKQSNIDSSEIYVNEFWGNENFRMLQVKLYACQNTTEKKNCASQEKINEYLNFRTLKIYIVDNYVSTHEYKKPFEKGLKEYFFYVTQKYRISLTQYLTHVYIESDDGYIFTTHKKDYNFKLDEMIEHTFYNQLDYFADFTIQLKNMIIDYRRKYYKLQDLIAQVGGVFSTLNIIDLIILRFYSDNSYFEYLINTHFEVRLNEVIKNKNLANIKNKKGYSKETVSSSNLNNKNEDKATENETELDNKNSINKNIKEKKTRLRLNFFDKLFLLNLFPNCSNAKKKKIDELYFRGKSYLMEYTDITQFMRNAHASEMRSKLMLDEEQKKVFDYIFKPILSVSFLGTRYNNSNLSSKIKEKLVGKQKKNNEQFMEKIEKVLPKIKKKKRKSVIKKKNMKAKKIQIQRINL